MVNNTTKSTKVHTCVPIRDRAKGKVFDIKKHNKIK